jgi:hypothetical protein
MDKQKQKEQEQQLKELAKKSPEKLRKTINEKLKGVSKPFCK